MKLSLLFLCAICIHHVFGAVLSQTENVDENASIRAYHAEDPNAICTEDLTFTSGYRGLTNIAFHWFCISIHGITVARHPFLQSLLAQDGVDSNKLMTLETPDENTDSMLIRAQQSYRSYILNRGEWFDPHAAQFSLFSLVCKPFGSMVDKDAVASAQVLFESPNFNLNGIVWQSDDGCSYDTVLEQVLGNIILWEQQHNHFGVREHNVQSRMFGLRYACAILTLMAKEHEKRVAALHEYKSNVKAMLAVKIILNRSIQGSTKDIAQHIGKFFRLRKPPPANHLDDFHLQRVLDLVWRSDILKINKSIRAIIPREYHKRAEFQLAERTYATVRDIYEDCSRETDMSKYIHQIEGRTPTLTFKPYMLPPLEYVPYPGLLRIGEEIAARVEHLNQSVQVYVDGRPLWEIEPPDYRRTRGVGQSCPPCFGCTVC